MEAVKTGMELLNLRMIVIQNEMNKQSGIFSVLERNMYDMPRHIEALQEILLQDIKYKFVDLKDFLTQKIQVPVESPADDKIFIMVDIKKLLKENTSNVLDTVLDTIVTKENSTQAPLNELHKENQTQIAPNTVPVKVAALQKIDEKIVKSETTTSMPKANQIKVSYDVPQRQSIEFFSQSCTQFF